MKKSIYICMFALLTMGTTNVSFAQNSKNIETEIMVEGVCKMCKARIENAAYIKGVKFCEWDNSSGKLKVVYNSEKINIETIHQHISEAGHSTNLVMADSLAYKKLPACCAYQDGVVKH